MHVIFAFALCVAVVGAAPRSSQRIVGGIATSIERYPFMAALLDTFDDNTFYQFCGGSIINTRSVLSAAHCTPLYSLPRLRLRLGSTYSTSGGVVYRVETVFNHEDYDDGLWSTNMDNDISVIRTATPIAYVDNLIQPAVIASPNYPIHDNDVVWPVGWGFTAYQGEVSEVLRHAQTWVINQELCVSRYDSFGYDVTPSMICSGWLDMGGRGQCSGDSGGPMLHNGVIVGITAWSYQCVDGFYPTVSMRPSHYYDWIQARA